MIIWFLGILGAVIGVIGDYILYKSVKRTTGKLKTSFVLFLLAAVTYLLSILVIILSVIAKIPLTNWTWNIVPLLFILASLFWASSMSRLVKIFSKGGSDK